VTKDGSMELEPAKSHVVAQWKHDRPLIACRFDPSGTYVFCGSEDNNVERFHAADGTKTMLAGGHATWVKALAFSPDGQFTISGGYDGKLTWWETAADSPVPLRSIVAHGSHWIRCLDVAPSTNVLASCGNDNAIRLWQVNDGTPIRELIAHDKHVYSVTFDAAGKQLFSGDLGGTIRQWNVADATQQRTLDAKELWSFNAGQKVDFGGVRALACSPDGKWLAAGGLYKASNPLGAIHEPIVLLINLATGAVEKKLIAAGITRGVVWRLRWLSDGSLMAVCGGGDGGFLLFWKPDAEKEFFRFKLPNIARDMDLHPDGLRVATAHHDQHVRITLLSSPPA
jgi:WD40 repeat protein